LDEFHRDFPFWKHGRACKFPFRHTMCDAKAARRARFLGVFPVIRDELIDHVKQQGFPESAAEWYQRVSTFSDFMFSVYSNVSVEL
jgi:hypothetical protein